jgi:SAM-dependent methyltransferase
MGFRHEAERALDDLARQHGIDLHKRPELTLTGGRADAVFNRLVVEWEPPGALAAHTGHTPNKHAIDQVRAYVDGLAEQERREVERLLGVACDGHFMIFARYRAGRWIVDEPVPVDDLSAEQLLESIVAAHGGRALTAANLLQDFGPQTPLTRRVSRALLDQLDERVGHAPDGFTSRLFRQWETLFAVATGVVGDADELKLDARRALGDVFGVAAGEVNSSRALFALQTYFAVVTKLIALLALSLFVPGVELDLSEMAVSGDGDLWEDLEDVQRGEPFRRAGLANVVEPDVFGWYLDWTPEVRNGVRELVEKLAQYDPATLHVSPEDARDLLKDLYQGLLPRPVRHALGQYFTPDWLAQQLLQQVEYNGNPSLRVVDPACGTGTFLVLAISQAKERLRRSREPEAHILETILRNVVGFDIDPLAAVAARTNYVLALGSLIRAVPPGTMLDIPVYLADSIVMPALGETLVSGDSLLLETAAGTFSLPTCVDTGDALRSVCDLAAAGIESGQPLDAFVEDAASACSANSRAREVLADFYRDCLEQHELGDRDALWPHVLRNAFMPVAAPVRDDDRTSAWLTAPAELVPALRKLAENGAPSYTAHEGVNTGGANGVLWVSIEGSRDAAGTVPISNLHDVGKTRVPKKYGRAESELIHPLVRGSDVRRWSAHPSAHLLLVQDSRERRGIDSQTMSDTYPQTLAFLAQFEKLLRARAAFRRYYTRGKGGSRVETGPYWSMFNVGTYTLAPYKVVWKDIATEFAAAVVESSDSIVVGTHTVMEIACSSADEAHYISGLLNSTPARTLVASYVATHISTHTVQVLHVPRFDLSVKMHRALAEASRAAHAAVAAGQPPNERAVDAAARRLWGLTTQDIDSMHEYLDRLLKRDTE